MDAPPPGDPLDDLPGPLPDPLDGVGPLGMRRLGDRGPALVLIHGMGRAAAAWAPAARPLASRALVFLPDNPGIGTSRGLCVPRTVEEHARLHARTLESACVAGDVHVVGLSLGGMIACALAAQLGGRCASLSVLAASSRETGFWRLAPPALLKGLLRILAGRSRQEAMLPELVARETLAAHPRLGLQVTELHEREGARRGLILRQLAAAARFRAGPLAGRLPERRQVIVGTADRLVPPGNSRRLARLLDAPLHELPGRGHDLALDGGSLLRDLIARMLPEAPRPSPSRAEDA